MRRFNEWKEQVERNRKPPKWQWFDVWVLGGAIVGLVVAIGVFCLVQIVLFRNFAVLKNINRAATDVKPSDVVTMTATALGGLAIGGVAVMQYRKHRWEEYQAAHQTEFDEKQAELEEDAKTGERLSKAIEHLGAGDPGDKEKLHIRLGAIYELKRLAQDSTRDKENIVQILTAFIKSYPHEEGQAWTQDVETAARLLSPLTRELIEETAEGASEKGRVNPPKYVFEATEALSGFAVEKNGLLCNEYIEWNEINVGWLNVDNIVLLGADLSLANLEGTYLTKANLYGANLCLANLNKAFLMGANLQGACLQHANLKNASANDARLEGANLYGANLKEAYLWGTSLNGADFGSAKLHGARLEKTHLEGANFCYAAFDEETRLDGAHIDSSTRFDPGVRLKYFGVEEPEHPE